MKFWIINDNVPSGFLSISSSSSIQSASNSFLSSLTGLGFSTTFSTSSCSAFLEDLDLPVGVALTTTSRACFGAGDGFAAFFKDSFIFRTSSAMLSVASRLLFTGAFKADDFFETVETSKLNFNEFTF